jgi:hypothetical protein
MQVGDEVLTHGVVYIIEEIVGETVWCMDETGFEVDFCKRDLEPINEQYWGVHEADWAT